MPETEGRDAAASKNEAADGATVAPKRPKRGSVKNLSGRSGWVAPTMVTLMLLGVAWLVVWYLTSATGIYIPGMHDIGNWNLLIGMGLMAASFAVATQWK